MGNGGASCGSSLKAFVYDHAVFIRWLLPARRCSSRALLIFIFAVSGFSGLIYESIWTHYLKLYLGHAAYAQTLVLAIFMGGMVLGALICSRFSHRWKNLVLGYALTEGAIGLFSLFFHDIFVQFVGFAFDSVIPNLGSATSVNIFKWVGGALLILPQSILLGMTFPLMSAGIIRRYAGRPGATIASLYFANSIGGATGILTSGFLSISLLGLAGTMAMAGIINIVLAIVVWSLVRDWKRPSSPKQIEPGRDSIDGSLCRPLVAVAFFTGLASFIYEIGWIRMLSLVLGSSTHAFELMLSAFILGLAFGGLWIRRRIDKLPSPLCYLAHVQVLMGLLALATLSVYGNTFNLMNWLIGNLPKNDAGYLLFNLSSHAIAMAIMLPATFFAGMTLPLITFMLLRTRYGERSIGVIYGANTLGAIGGVFLAVHILMPAVGLKGLIIAGGAVDIALGLALLWWWRSKTANRIHQPALTTVIGLGAITATLLWVQLDIHKMASGIYRNANSPLFYGKTEFVIGHKDGKTATVDLSRSTSGVISIRTNGKVDASIKPDAENPTPDEVTMVMAGTLPLLFSDDARTAANIGMGSGLTSHVLLEDDRLERLDTIEIEAAMVELAQGFRPRNRLVYTDPRSRIHIDDAKTFFSTHGRQYDIIVSEPSNPWISGVSGLFSTEFYALIRNNLTEQGIFAQWLQVYEINEELVVSILKALSQSFDDYAVYMAHVGDFIIVAKKEGVLPEIDERLFRAPGISQELARIGIRSLQDIELRLVGNKALFGPLLASYEIRANSDYYPVLDQNAVRSRFLKHNAGGFLAFSNAPYPTFDILGVSTPRWNRSTVVPSELIEKTKAAYTATIFRDYLAYIHGDLKDDSIPPAPAGKVIDDLIGYCVATIGGTDKLPALFNIAVKVVPYLRPAELEPLWRYVEDLPCASGLTSYESGWLDFFKAVGKRAPAEIVQTGQELLDTGLSMTDSLKEYLVISMMLGHIALDQQDSSLRLWDQYGAGLMRKGPLDMFYRMLRVLAEHTGASKPADLSTEQGTADSALEQDLS